jgi:hypothetical protein
MSPSAMRVPSTSVFMVARPSAGALRQTSVALTDAGRKALQDYSTVLRQLLDSASQPRIGS